MTLPHVTFKIRPGVDTNETPVLNQAAVSSCNLIRYKPDADQGLGLVEKLGGWAKFYTGKMQAVVRQLLAWQDLQGFQWVAVGMDVATSGPAAGQDGLAVLSATQGPSGVTTGSNLKMITPIFLFSDVAPSFSTIAGSATITVTDTVSTNILPGSVVYIANEVSVGGIPLFGLYQVTASTGLTTYQITGTTKLGAPYPAETTVTNGGAVATITTAAGSSVATVTLVDHDYNVGDTFSVLVPTTVGGVLFYKDYVVQSVPDDDHLTIQASATAATAQTLSINSGNARLVYSVAQQLPSSATGFGIGGFGSGGFGTGGSVPVVAALPAAAIDWSLDNWGELLLAGPEQCIVDGINTSGIYVWDPTTGATNAVLIPQAPPVNDGFFVAMPQRQIIAWGSTFTGTQDALLVRWCDIENFNSWLGTVTNQAGSYRISKGSKIVAGIQGPQQGILWTDLGVWSMQYIGPPYVYSFNEIGNGCGLIAKKAAASVNGIVYWMSQTQFFKLDSTGVTPLNCPVWDVIFQNLDLTNVRKIRVAPNSRFGEVSWFYPSLQGGGEVDRYVKYNFLLNAWDFGVLGRTAWINQSVIGPPLGADPASLYLYQHEISPDADGQPLLATFTTGFFSLSDADVKTFVDEVWPDMKWGYYGSNQNATVQLTFGVADFPAQAPLNFGPFPVTAATTFFSPRLRGRLIQITVASNDIGSFWRIGGLRYRGAPDGRY